MAKESGNNFSCVLNYMRGSSKCKAGFRTDEIVFVWGDSSKTKGLWICRDELEECFPSLKGSKKSKKIKLLVSTVRHQGYSKVSEHLRNYVNVTINGETDSHQIYVDRTVTAMLDKLLGKWNVKALYFKFNRMD